MSFTFRHLKPDDSYFPNWQDMRHRTRLAWLAFAAWLPLTLLLSLLCNTTLRWHGFPWVALPGALLIIVARLYQTAWPCPRCGKPFYFYAGLWLYWPFANSCLHCGLPEYASDGWFST